MLPYGEGAIRGARAIGCAAGLRIYFEERGALLSMDMGLRDNK